MSHDRVENWETIGRTNRWIISIFIYFNVEEIEKGIHTYRRIDTFHSHNHDKNPRES